MEEKLDSLISYQYRIMECMTALSCDFSIAHLSVHTFGNAGDNLLVKALRATIRKFLDVPCSFVPVNVRDELNDCTLNICNSSRMVVIGGGGLFLRDTNANDISGWQFPVSINKLSQIKVPFCLLGVGYNRFRGQEEFAPCFKENINAVVERAKFIGLRNYGSIRAIQAYLRADLKDKICFHPCPTTVLSKIFVLPSGEERNFIALNMAFDRENLRYGDKKDDICQSVAKVMKILSERYEVRVYIHSDNDYAIIPYLEREKVPFVTVVLNQNYTEDDYLKFYTAPQLVFGMRGHAQMIPFGCVTPILSIISHDKLRWFLEDIKHPEWGVDVKDNDFERKLGDVAEYILNNKAKIKRELLEAQDYLWDVTQKNFAKIFDMRQLND